MLQTLLGPGAAGELVSFWGLVAIYQYFLVPLCVLTFLPALAAVRPELREAATVHGARVTHVWQYVGLAERLVEAVPCAERVVFTATGAEATYVALRLARSATGCSLAHSESDVRETGEQGREALDACAACFYGRE